ncbi:hypothetical protein VE04_09785, partial [Pseudogymnoascus sp. 24MN13]
MAVLELLMDNYAAADFATQFLSAAMRKVGIDFVVSPTDAAPDVRAGFTPPPDCVGELTTPPDDEDGDAGMKLSGLRDGEEGAFEEQFSSCSHALVQLVVFVTLNIVTDVMLIILPMPWLIRMKTSLEQRIAVIGLFSIGFLLIAIAIVRLPIYMSRTSQIDRNTWGSVEEFAAAFVANAPTLFTLRRRRPTTDTESFQNTHRLATAGFKQVLDDGIIVTHSIELRRERSRNLNDLDEFSDTCIEHTEQFNNDDLVHAI